MKREAWCLRIRLGPLPLAPVDARETHASPASVCQRPAIQPVRRVAAIAGPGDLVAGQMMTRSMTNASITTAQKTRQVPMQDQKMARSVSVIAARGR